YPVTECIHQRFEAQVDAFPEHIAVSYQTHTLTYRELNAKANQLAHWLTEQGVEPDSRVAIALERSESLLVAILATLKAGGAYVPLDPNYPQQRLTYTLEDSQPQVVITSSELVERLGELPSHTQIAQMDNPQWLAYSSDNLSSASLGVTPHNLAYIIYTSGSTGNPKGVMVEHQQVLRLMAATQEDYQFNQRDVWTLFHSYAFDFSVWEIWGALLFGGRLVVVPHLISRTPSEFYQLLCDERVTVLNQTPSAFRQLIAAQDARSHQLRYVIFGGEALELSALAPWFAKAHNQTTQLVNMYGITETTVHTTYYPLTEQDVTRTGASPIGRGINDLSLYLLDEHRQPVPIGVTGEIYVSGAGVARGYFNRPELTDERFMLDPFVADGSTRMYKSGDLGRWLADGSIEYLGRNDDQVKI
ncbi:amino acid adenylation domain-containing protein, partial [Vibrio xiamenensis]